jgi:Double-GTPase 1
VSDPVQARVVLLGMPRSGKSTYLGALWALVQSHLESSVSEADFRGDRTYVQRLAEHVSRAEEIARTAMDAEDSMVVTLRFASAGTAELVIPDTSGEALRLLVEERAWYPRLRELLEECTAIMLFVHPERLRVPQPLAVLAAPAGGAAESEGMPFEPREHASTAAELIEIFENVADVCRDRWPIRVALVVSAWDTVEGDPLPAPREWLRERLPAFFATLESNPQIAELAAFGVSAQGGPLSSREDLLARGDVCDRVYARDGDGRPASLAEPLRWAIWGT